MVRARLGNLVVGVIICFVALMTFLVIFHFSDFILETFGRRQKQASEDPFVTK